LKSEIKTASEELERVERELKRSFDQTSEMVDSDEIQYTVTVRNKEGNIDHKSTAYCKVYGGMKIDVSSGVLFHNLPNESFRFEPNGSGSSTIVKNKNNDVLKPLFPVVFTHFYWRSKGFTSLGASVGLGIDDSGKAGYYGGPALLLGDRQRVVISLGCALRPTDVLKGQYSTGEVIPNTELPETSDLVESAYRAGFFFALTYNLTAKVERRK
jgi:hypothetical protein